MSHPIEVILIGAGQRGHEAYGQYILDHPNQFRLVAVAEPNTQRRAATAAAHNIPAERQYASWDTLLGESRGARAAIIATQDQQHTAPTVAALQAGYDVLLEKPMANRRDACVQLVQAAENTGRLLQIGHVLRYTPTIRRMRALLSAGTLGDIVTIEHHEYVSFWHMAHSYVRGNWRHSAETSPMILAKCCHDFDLLQWLLGRECIRLSSFGSLQQFRRERAPAGVPERCTDGCPVGDTCPYNAVNIYLELEPLLRELASVSAPEFRLLARLALTRPGSAALRVLSLLIPRLRYLTEYHSWPRSVISPEPGQAALRQALETGPYGRCVYHCDNDVVDNQVVALEFEGGISATLTMQGHSHREGRFMRWQGTRATLFVRLNMFSSELEVHDHRTRKVSRYRNWHRPGDGHGGGDTGLMEAFEQAIRGENSQHLTTARDALESHLLAFAAEEARLSGKVVDMRAYRETAWNATRL